MSLRAARWALSPLAVIKLAQPVVLRWGGAHMGMCTRQREKMGEATKKYHTLTVGRIDLNIVLCFSDTREYALKQIEGTGLSMSACR